MIEGNGNGHGNVALERVEDHHQDAFFFADAAIDIGGTGRTRAHLADVYAASGGHPYAEGQTSDYIGRDD